MEKTFRMTKMAYCLCLLQQQDVALVAQCEQEAGPALVNSTNYFNYTLVPQPIIYRHTNGLGILLDHNFLCQVQTYNCA